MVGKKIPSTIFLFTVKMESVTTTYPHLLALQKPTTEGNKMSTKFFLMVFESCQALYLILTRNMPMKHLSPKLLPRSLQKLRAARSECTIWMLKGTAKELERGETGGNGGTVIWRKGCTTGCVWLGQSRVFPGQTTS